MIDPLELVSPKRYAQHGYPHEAWTWLRKESPVTWCEAEGYDPFWAITKHADICEISKQPEIFLSEPRTVDHDEGRIRRGHRGAVEDARQHGPARTPVLPEGGVLVVHSEERRSARGADGRQRPASDRHARDSAARRMRSTS